MKNESIFANAQWQLTKATGFFYDRTPPGILDKAFSLFDDRLNRPIGNVRTENS
jgi:hypothetical protein